MGKRKCAVQMENHWESGFWTTNKGNVMGVIRKWGGKRTRKIERGMKLLPGRSKT